MKRGDTAMWVLTKMAMLFFIAALSAIILVVTNVQKTGLCDEEARAISGRISNALTQLLNTPVEDERRVLQLEQALSIGGGQRARYSMTLTRREIPGKPFHAVIVKVTSELDPACSAGVQITYPEAFDANPKRLFFLPAVHASRSVSRPIRDDAQALERMAVKPSVLNELKDGPRSTFITLLKCTAKKIDGLSYYYVQDCTQKDSTQCINLETQNTGVAGAGSPKQLCGFGGTTGT